MRLEEAIKQKKFTSPFHKAVLNIRVTDGWLSGIILPVLKKYGLSEEQFNVLRILKGQHPQPSALQLVSERMLNPMSNVTRLVEKLRLGGLVTRDTCPHNRRKVDILITQPGLDLLAKVTPLLEKEMQKHQHISDEEIETLNNLLDKMRG